PEAILVMERLIERAGREMDIAPAEIRRRNLVLPEAMPYTNALGVTYDSGEFEQTMDAAERLADVEGFPARRRDSESRGLLRGIGYAMMLESGGVGLPERADVECTPTGRLIVRIGTMSNGQSHETVYAQMLADTLGVDIEAIEIRQGDSAETPWGMGTGASRSITVGGSALIVAGKQLIDAGRAIAADLLEAASADLSYACGAYSVTGTDRRATLTAVAAHAATRGLALDASYRYVPEQGTYPNGCHIAEVEIDPETGVTTVARYSAAQDVGRALNPMVIEGQIAGGIVQGIGEALTEAMRYDTDSAQVLTGSFLDYAMPRADLIPSIAIAILEVPCTHTPTGAKSVGETGTTAAPAAIANAMLDALAPMGVGEIELPATPEGVRRAFHP
ncbi:MAG: molybdopterin cofactor-binding domain-containing protein, partial [Burkholderiales bacterium]